MSVAEDLEVGSDLGPLEISSIVEGMIWLRIPWSCLGLHIFHFLHRSDAQNIHTVGQGLMHSRQGPLQRYVCLCVCDVVPPMLAVPNCNAEWNPKILLHAVGKTVWNLLSSLRISTSSVTKSFKNNMIGYAGAEISTWVQEKSLQQVSGAHQENLWYWAVIMTSWIAQNRHIITTLFKNLQHQKLVLVD